MDITVYTVMTTLISILTIIGMVKKAGIMNVFAILLGLVGTAEVVLDGGVSETFGTCFSSGCSTVSFTLGGDMPLLFIALLTIINAVMLMMVFKS